MKKLLALILLLPSLAFAQSSAGTCSDNIAVTTSSTQVIAADDIPGGRHFLLIQNIGGNPAFCALGETATTGNGFYLPAISTGTLGGSLLLQSVEGENGVFYKVPPKAVNCIGSGGSTTIQFCDY